MKIQNLLLQIIVHTPNAAHPKMRTGTTAPGVDAPPAAAAVDCLVALLVSSKDS
jgi:hypothetical protein